MEDNMMDKEQIVFGKDDRMLRRVEYRDHWARRQFWLQLLVSVGLKLLLASHCLAFLLGVAVGLYIRMR